VENADTDIREALQAAQHGEQTAAEAFMAVRHVRQTLSQQLKVCQDARQERDRRRAEFRAVCLAAVAEGIPLARVAAAAQVSRQTLYNWQAEAKGT
jgi:DNA-binding phage protein